MPLMVPMEHPARLALRGLGERDNLDNDLRFGQQKEAVMRSLLAQAVWLFSCYGMVASCPVSNVRRWTFSHGYLSVQIEKAINVSDNGRLVGTLREIPSAAGSVVAETKDGQYSGGVVRPGLKVEIARLTWDKALRHWYPTDDSVDALHAIIRGLLQALGLGPGQDGSRPVPLKE